MKRPILLSAIDKMAPLRPDGYKDDLLAHGEVKDDKLWIEWADYQQLLDKYAPNSKKKLIAKPCCGQGKPRGLGDVVAKVAQPIARGIDRVFGSDVQHCGGCKKRQEYLNRLVSFSGSK